MPKFVKTQWHDVKGNAKWDFIKGGVIVMISSLAAILRFLGHAPLWQVLAVFFATSVCVAFVFWMIQKWKPFKSDSYLEIEAIPYDITPPQKHWCKIRVLNKSSTITADNVQVELLELNDSLGNEAEAKYFRPPFPVILKPEIAGANTINPGASLTYNLFQVTMIKGATQKENETEPVWHWRFLAYFAQDTTKNLTQFFGKEKYRLKLTASARDLLKVEQEFDLTFSDEGTFCRFNLTNAQPNR